MVNSTITKQQLEQSPSFVAGFSSVIELNTRIVMCEMVQEAVILLRLPQVAAATAQVLIHRLMAVVSLSSFTTINLVGGVL